MLAENGVQALGMAEQIRPQLIILDVSMPEIDGYTVCRQLKGACGDKGYSCDIHICL